MTPRPRRQLGVRVAVALALAAPSLAAAQGVESPRLPLRTALNEIEEFRNEYSDAFNQKDVKALTAMYLPDAVVIRGDGSTLRGQEAIAKGFAEDTANWGQATFSRDTSRVFGRTAWEVGTLRSPRSGGGGEEVSHYLVVLRRGMKNWRISSVAVVPETASGRETRPR